MNITKKWLTIFLTVVLMLTMAVPAFASGGTNNGKITISNAVKDQKYSVYRIFNLDSYNKDEHAYLYTVNDNWKNFISQPAISGNDGYVTVDDKTGLVTWNKKDDSGVAEFAKKALEYAKDANHLISPTKGPTAAGGTTITFENLPLGYYLVDSSLGALCALNTTDFETTMEEKNGQPTVDKKVQEGGKFDTEAGAQIGDTVTFRTTITAEAGAENYVLYDKMTKGLAFKGITSVIKNPGNSPVTLTSPVNYTLTEGTVGGDYSFKMEFSKDVCSGLSVGDKIVVTYTAILTSEAEIGGVDLNKNEAWLKYGDNANTETIHVETSVYTHQFQLVKTDEGKNGTYNVLTDARFKLYDAASGGNEVKVVKVKDGEYRVAATDSEAGITDCIEAGAPIIKGLDAKSYWLEETKAPDGFNKLKGRFEVKITGDNLVGSGELTGTGTVQYKPDTNNPGGVHIKNHAGGMLPSTGGIGTIIFYMLGAVLVIGAIAILIMRKINIKEK